MYVRKGFYYCGILVIVLFSLVTFARAAATIPQPTITSASIGKKELKGATGVIIIKGDLTRSGEIPIKGTADGGGPQVKKVEVSLDGGKTWKVAAGKDTWQYRFIPFPNNTYYLTLRVTNAEGVISDPKAFGVVKFSYLSVTLWELIQQKADELAKAYMSRDLEQYMGLISRNYQNYPRGQHRLRRTIDKDFKFLNNNVLRFTVDQVFELEGTIMAEM
jgi:hypothetical protein